ncbi:hypothetical protein [Nitrosospira multiformis]|uniref:hypothetical protein n=1 Tax=Nitrosospira multiformis TaxID=1231 RepID=UPI0015A6C8F9|nr:hypothetical protein [Nitrosospira multiformis]
MFVLALAINPAFGDRISRQPLVSDIARQFVTHRMFLPWFDPAPRQYRERPVGSVE